MSGRAPAINIERIERTERTALPRLSADERASPRNRGPSAGERAMAKVRERSAQLAREVREARVEQKGKRVKQAIPGERVATQAEIEQVAALLNSTMLKIIHDPRARGWYKLFNHMDDDLSGKISYWELEDMVRNELHIPLSQFPEEKLQAIWRALDVDRSGLITCGEFGHFMRLGETETKAEKWQSKLFKAKKIVGDACRQQLKQELAERKQVLESIAVAKKEKAVHDYEVAWGLRAGRKTQPWKSPRARIW